MRLSVEDADKRKRCKNCGRLFKVPALEQLQKAIEQIRQAHTRVYVDEKGNVYG
jgi:uncharacterized paraquat-inducible protein A